MINEKIINIAIDAEQQEKVRKNSASSLPLNPTAQGWSAQKIREKLYRAICSDVGDLDDNLLDIIVDKLLSVKEVFEALQTGEFVVKKAELSEGGQNIEITLQDLQNRMNVSEQDIDKIEDGTTVVGKALKDDLGNTIKSTYANKLDLVYSSSNNRVAITLKSADGTTIDADLIDLPKATTSKDGLMAKEDKTKLNNIEIDVGQLQTNKADLVGGKIPASQLPAYVDDVLEFDTFDDFPAVGQSDTVYIAIDTNKTYRWTGTSYVVIGSDLALGETSSTAYRGDRGKTAYDHSQIVSGNPHQVTKSDVGLGNVDNTSDLNKPISTATQNELNKKADKFTLTNLVENGDLLIDSNSDNIPDGFALQGTVNNMTLVNGVWSFETTGGYKGVKYPYNFIAGTQYYIFGKGKTTLSGTNLYVEYATRVEVPISDTMQFFSKTITVGTSASDLYVLDNRSPSSPTNSTSIDYIGAINLTAIFGAGNEPSKEAIDRIIQTKGFFQTTDITIKDLLDISDQLANKVDNVIKEKINTIEKVYENHSIKKGITSEVIQLINNKSIKEIGLSIDGNEYANILGEQNQSVPTKTGQNRIIPNILNSFSYSSPSAVQTGTKTFNIINGHKYFVLCHWNIVDFNLWNPYIPGDNWIFAFYNKTLTTSYGASTYTNTSTICEDYFYGTITATSTESEASMMFAFGAFPIGSVIKNMVLIDLTVHGLETLTDNEIYSIFNVYFSNTKKSYISVVNTKTLETDVLLDEIEIGNEKYKKIYQLPYIDGEIKFVNMFGTIKYATTSDDLLKSYMFYIDSTCPFSDFIGKNIAFLGDSITQGNGMGIPAPDYQKLRFSYLICNELGANELNYGFSGTSIGENATITNTAFVNRFTSISQYSDIIFVLGGTNDYHLLTALGDMNSSTKDTFYGALKIMASGLLGTKHIGARVIFATPPKRNEGGVANAIGVFFEQYVKAIRDVANFYGIELLDLYNILPFDRTTDKGLYLMNDKVHPNPNGNIYMKNIIIKQLVYGI